MYRYRHKQRPSSSHASTEEHRRRRVRQCSARQYHANITSAGVAGLTTALLLSKSNKYKIVVAAKHMPGDYDIEYASPWAGANYMPYSILRPFYPLPPLTSTQGIRPRHRSLRMGPQHLAGA